MADGERADVTSTARAARSLCAGTGSARSSRPLSATLLCHAQLIQSPCPLSSAHRPTVSASDRGSVSASAEKATTTTKKNHAVAKTHPLELNCSHVTAPAWPGQFSQAEANALGDLRAKADNARRVNLPSSSLAFPRANFTFSHQTAADTLRKGGGMLEARAIRATVDRLLASCWKTEDRRRCSGHVLASNISHIQYKHEVTVVWTSRRGPCKPERVS
jgi:hypothetical protein